jgi:hypothetical protein
MPVAAMAPTILSSSHLLPVPIAPVNVAICGYSVSELARIREIERGIGHRGTEARRHGGTEEFIIRDNQ